MPVCQSCGADRRPGMEACIRCGESSAAAAQGHLPHVTLIPGRLGIRGGALILAGFAVLAYVIFRELTEGWLVGRIPAVIVSGGLIYLGLGGTALACTSCGKGIVVRRRRPHVKCRHCKTLILIDWKAPAG